MKAVILAGGMGTRLSEETGLRPKPMVEIGGKPILWHIMKIYSAHGVNDFIISIFCLIDILQKFFRASGFILKIPFIAILLCSAMNSGLS